MAEQGISVEELLAATVDLTPEERAAFLARTVHERPETGPMVAELLRGFAGAGSAVGRDLVAGTKVGRYAVVDRLGAGGMGVVYRAHDAELERTVAIKVLAWRALANEDARRRFRKEALALAKLSHAQIAAIYDVGRAELGGEGDDSVDYIVMECVPGESLAAKVKGGPLPVKDATAIALQMAQALEEAHEHGVIHRDLKPANVMVTPKGQAKVLDFGLAKLFAPMSVTQTVTEEGVLAGTPRYMSPEQARGRTVNAQTDLWSLGVIYYELLTGGSPFEGEDTLSVLRAIVDDAPVSLSKQRADVPALGVQIVGRALEKDPAKRYQTAAEMVQDLTELLAQLSGAPRLVETPGRKLSRAVLVATALVLVAAVVLSGWAYRRASRRDWARGEAIPEIGALQDKKQHLAAYLLLQQAQQVLPDDPTLKKIAEDTVERVSVTSDPAGATVEIQDYVTPHAGWYRLGVTPLTNVQVPGGFYRWKVSKAGVGESVTAPNFDDSLNFSLTAMRNAPAGMVAVPAGKWANYIGFLGWLGPYSLPAFYADQYEVTNREYQKFVDGGGYANKAYWSETFTKEGKVLSFDEAMLEFRDTSGRAGPATWVGGHYPEGMAEYPVSGVSWYEAAAYARYAGKQLPVVAQWYRLAAPDASGYIVPLSNMTGKALAPVGAYPGLGPFGTYDMAGNVREWVANADMTGKRFILGGSWRSPAYGYSDAEAQSAFDRTDTNGFRCVRNAGALSAQVQMPLQDEQRDYARFKPATDAVFHAYEALYAYPKLPLNATVDGIVNETADWREEKVSFDTAYRGERMSAYLFLPKHVKPPYQTVLFFPSARVYFVPSNNGGKTLGDIEFFDYVVQSGRAVMYPIYEDMYERRTRGSFPGGAQNIELTADWYKDASRSLDYLATRKDIDSNKLAYLGVSMGAAEGVIAGELLQDRLKAIVLLDGGFFLEPPPAGGDQADFAPRIKKPVLMVNGRYDYAFSVERAQNPLFAMLGTDKNDKSHVVLDTPHDVTEQKPLLTKAVLDWLDQYLGRVGD